MTSDMERPCYVAAADFIAPLGENHSAVVPPGAADRCVLPTQVAAVLQRTREFTDKHSLTAVLGLAAGMHLRRKARGGERHCVDADGCFLCREANLGSLPITGEEMFARLRAIGALVSADELALVLERAHSGHSTARSATPCQLVVVTRDRPHECTRGLASHLAQIKREGLRPRVMVVDASSSSECAHVLARGLRTLVQAGDIEVRRAAGEERQAFIAALLTRSAAPRSVLEYALASRPQGSDIGANRNYALLATIGSRVLQFDDDMISPVSTRTVGRRVAFCSGHAFLKFQAYASRDEARTAGNQEPRGVSLDAMQACLGESLSTCAGHAQVDLGPLNARFASNLLEGRGRVRVAFSGISGDSGEYSPFWRLISLPSLMAGIARMPERYKLVIMSREIVRHAPVTTITDSEWFMAGAVGLDNTSFLPPFIPHVRNEDGLFGAVLRACCPDAYCAHLPMLVYHEPTGSREHAADALYKPAIGWRLADLLICLTHRWGRSAVAWTNAPDERAVRLAEYLESAATQCRSQDLWREVFIEHLEDLAANVRDRLDSAGSIARPYENDLREWLRLANASVGSRESALPSDVVGADTQERVERLVRAIADYAQCMWHWPTIRQAAGDLAHR